MSYLQKKISGTGEPHPEKLDRERFLTVQDVQKLLDCIENSGNKFARRDHAMVFFGFYLGLRVGEVAWLSRENFRDLQDGVIRVIREKTTPRIPHWCRSCGRRCRVSYKTKELACANCGETNPVTYSKKLKVTPEERELPVVETHVIEYAKEYLDSLPVKQDWLFQGQDPKKHITSSFVGKIFNTYVAQCGLSQKYSWHALRHGRGVFIWERFHDLKLVQDCLGQTSLSSAEIYMHLSPERREEYQRVLDQYSHAAN